jgi:hypothetical protein
MSAIEASKNRFVPSRIWRPDSRQQIHLGLSVVQNYKSFAGEYSIPLREANQAMRVKERSQALKNALFKNWPSAAEPGFYC